MKKLIPFAIVYDFDGTLAPGNMQERDFIPDIGMNKKKFWAEVSKEAEEHEADEILVYMQLMLKKADEARVPVRKQDIKSYGKGLSFFKGISKEGHEKGWFDRINYYGKTCGIKVEHYVISSGIKEIIKGSSIGNKFKTIYASSFRYDQNGVASWPALAINYTTKTQYLFRINKGCLDVYDKKGINKFTPEKDRTIPFRNMIYIGDGETDIPCFRLVKDRGGNSIAVYKPKTRGGKKICNNLINDERVNFVAPADYSVNSTMDRLVKSIIDKIQTDYHLQNFEYKK